jgi:hypothetical protein
LWLAFFVDILSRKGWSHCFVTVFEKRPRETVTFPAPKPVTASTISTIRHRGAKRFRP